jgi:4'-phosphopantetheinyl transferase
VEERATVQVYVARPWAATTLDALLDDADRRHLGGLRHEEDRDRCATGRALLRDIVGDLAITRACPDCDRPHGKPLVEGLHVNLAHSARMVLLAITRAGPIGVDVEATGAAEFAGMDDLVPAEATFSRTERWVRAEARLKRTGGGLRTEPHLAAAPHTYLLDVGPKYVAALATTTPSDIEIIDADGLLAAWVASGRTATA